MLAWVMNLGFAASGADAPAVGDTVREERGAFLLIGTGCWVAPLVAAALTLGVR